MDKRLVAGCMTGTSIDGIDAALVELTGRGWAIQASILRTASRPLGGLADGLRRLAGRQPFTAGQIAAMARELAWLHLRTLRDLIGDERPDLVAVHGQTVYHHPPVSWQLIQPAPIAHGLGVPVVFDLRAADLAAGGQGAPITPLADYVLFAHPGESRTVVNLGGFCNYTALPRAGGEPLSQIAGIRGGDLCACNQLLDEVARRLWDCPYDAGGKRAVTGVILRRPYESLLELLWKQAGSARSLGTGDELAEWIAHHHGDGRGADLARTACAAIAETIARGVGRCDRILVAGGSVKNAALMSELADRAGGPVTATDAHGVPAAYREAACVAVLGALCQDRIPITLGQITGAANPPIAGAWVQP